MTQSLLSALRALEEAYERASTPADFNDLWNKVQWIEALSVIMRRDQAEVEAAASLKAVVSKSIRAHLEGQDQPVDFSARVSAMEQVVKRRNGGADKPPMG